MKKLTLIIFLLGIAASTVWAQDVNIQQVDQEVRQAERNFNNNSLFLSRNLFGAFGAISNFPSLAADANQVARINLEGDNNTASITQSGSDNVGVISIDGSGNISSLTQDGSRLISAIGIEGNANTLDVTQSGTALQNLILLDGNGLNFDVLQTAGGVQLTQTGSSIPLQIEQSGGFLPIIISNN